MHVLVAEDDLATRHLLAGTLGKWGYDVINVADGNEAWAILQGGDAPRLAVLDWLMPGKSGIEICRDLRALNRRDYTYVIMLTARNRTEDVVEGLDAGADDYIIKPFDAKELHARIRAAGRMISLYANLLEARDELAALNSTLENRVEQRTEQVHRLLTQKDQFIRQLGHGLRTPLTPLVALLPLVAKRTRDSEAAEMLKLVMDNVEYMRDLADKTLRLANLNEAGTPLDLEPVDLAVEVSKVTAALKHEIEQAQMRVVEQIPARLGVIADPLLLREVLQNLILNAVRFAEGGGTVTVASGPTRAGDDGMVVFSVTDDGAGMTGEELSHAFEEFYKADPPRHDRYSPGLGLSICKRIVESHGGRIWLESGGPGLGTTAHVALKSADGEAAEPELIAAGQTAGTWRNPCAPA